jgi:hypothetical protein
VVFAVAGVRVVKSVLFAALLAAVALMGFHYGWVRIGALSGSCTQVVENADASVVEACRQGKLAGWPSLESHSCTFIHQSGSWQYWHCPAAIEASQVGR